MRVPVNVHRWERIALLHWPVPPAELAAVLPAQLTPLTWEGTAWVGVTPFRIHVRPPGLPFTPPGAAFPETNVRTYVAGPDGREGLWFLHMEVTAAWFVTALRAVGLPYVRQDMAVDDRGDVAAYRSNPTSSRGGHHIVVRPGAPLEPSSGGDFDRFLTARWGAYHRRGPALLHTPVEHPPWPLREAEVERCEVADLFAAGGLPSPAGQPIAHFSDGVEVKVGPPRLVT